MREKYVEFLNGLEYGLTPTQAAKRAKYKDPKSSASKLLRTPELQKRIGEINNMKRQEFSISRAKVQQGISDAIEMARLQADPVAMIRGFQEVNKMCGYYAPEEKRITLTDNQSHSVRELRTMPLQELIERADGEIIEGELLDDPEDSKYLAQDLDDLDDQD